jgi:transposase
VHPQWRARGAAAQGRRVLLESEYWRRQRENAELDALTPNKRGPKVPANRAEVQQIARLTREVGRLQGELDKAMLVIGVQKKLATLLGRPIDDETGNS